MIATVGGALLERLASHRRRALEGVWRAAADIQEATLHRLVAHARGTEFGQGHDFAGIRSVADYQARVPLRGYLDFQPLWQRALRGASNVTWPGRPRHWVKTSGTTAGDKVIPVTKDALVSHRRGGWDALFVALERTGGSQLLRGAMLFLGGTSQLTPIGDGALVGDLSGLAVRRLPPGCAVVIRRAPPSRRFRTGPPGLPASPNGSRRRISGCSRGCRPGCCSCSSTWAADTISRGVGRR